MGATSLRRYTNIASALHVLRNRSISLLNPAFWDDRNDAYYLASYKYRTQAASVLALCFARAPETYHHWRVFSSGGDGLCIEFDEARLIEAIGKDDAVTARDVIYKEIKDVSGGPIATEDLPFLKRIPYRDEQEFRLLYVNPTVRTEFHHIPIPVTAISRITLSPWMAAPLAKSVKDTLKELPRCQVIKIYQSTLVENERWKRAANPDLDLYGT
ncbi:MAG: DUF2971 domain-containing protein [Hyphomicrobium sp.]|nr:DUF2971 domain-containing protein [Hyphomicrobium sp.]